MDAQEWADRLNDGEVTETLREIMTAYDTTRTLWIEKHGTDSGFDAWFTRQVLGV